MALAAGEEGGLEDKMMKWGAGIDGGRRMGRS